jgi:hypothetical protein
MREPPASCPREVPAWLSCPCGSSAVGPMGPLGAVWAVSVPSGGWAQVLPPRHEGAETVLWLGYPEGSGRHSGRVQVPDGTSVDLAGLRNWLAVRDVLEA